MWSVEISNVMGRVLTRTQLWKGHVLSSLYLPAAAEQMRLRNVNLAVAILEFHYPGKSASSLCTLLRISLIVL